MGCGGGGGGSGEIRRQQQEEEARIRQGVQAINAIFGGGTYGANPVANFALGQQYYTQQGQPYKFDVTDPAFLKWVKDNRLPTLGARPTYGRERVRPSLLPTYEERYGKELASKGQLFSGTQTTPGFTPGFYAQRAKQYEDYALPTLAEQYGQLRKNVAYNLTNKGLLGSSVASEQAGSLERELGRKQREVADTGLGLAQDLQRQVEQERAQLITQLQASADPTTSTQLALGAASRFQAPSPLPPIGNFFNTWSQIYLANQLANGAQQQQPGYNKNTAGASSPLGSTGRIVQ